MPFNNQFPYTDLHEINLNKFLKAIKNLLGGHGGEFLKKKSNIPFDYEWSNIDVSAGVDSVNGQTGTVVLTASDVGALPDSYTPPAAPVQSVNGKTGSVVLSASDVGALPDSYTPPVQSVNGNTGSVVLSASDVGALSSTPVFIQASGASGAFTDVSGGFYQFGNIVVVQILATTTRSISAGDYFTLATNAPTPAIEGVSLVANTGQVSNAPVVMAHARTTGYIYIKAATTAIGTNQYIFCTGVYIKQ